jgi:hypothetical protein
MSIDVELEVDSDAGGGLPSPAQQLIDSVERMTFDHADQ